MAVTSVSLHFNGTTGGRTNDGKVEYTAAYLVTTDTVRDQTAVICDHFKNAGNLPYLNKPYAFANDSDPSAICSGIDPRRQANSATSWIVTFKYSTPQGKKDEDEPDRKEKDADGNLTNNPELWRERWDISFTQRMVEEHKLVYRGGMQGAGAIPVNTVTPMINSCLEPFIPPPEKEHDITVYRRSFYKTGWDGALADQFQGKVNANAFDVNRADLRLMFHVNPFCMRMKSLGASLEYINAAPWWNWNLEFWVDPLGWRKVVADRGLNRRATEGYATGRGYVFAEGDFVDGRARLIPILDTDGNPIRTPVLLDGAGGPLVTNATFPEPVWLTYSLYDEIDFPVFLFGFGAFPVF